MPSNLTIEWIFCCRPGMNRCKAFHLCEFSNGYASWNQVRNVFHKAHTCKASPQYGQAGVVWALNCPGSACRKLPLYRYIVALHVSFNVCGKSLHRYKQTRSFVLPWSKKIFPHSSSLHTYVRWFPSASISGLLPEFCWFLSKVLYPGGKFSKSTSPSPS